MGEKVKRLHPKSEVLRELYMKSGNQCAFPGCHNCLIDEKGNFIGQVCHIEAAEKGGERFNPNMTNEERRAFDNLILLCYKHHVETDDVNEYTVEKMKMMKKNHEDIYSGIVQKIVESVKDYGYVTNYKESKKCQKLSDVLQYGCTVEENLENAKILNEIIKKMIDIPVETRQLLVIMVSRSYKINFDDCVVPLHEVEMAIKRDSNYLSRQIEIMQRRGLMSESDIDEYGNPVCYMCGDRETGWNYWNDIREFCKKSGTPLEKICVELDLSVFD